MEKGNLTSILKGSTEITLLQVLKWAMEAAAGMAHLHEEGIVHRDLAARNLLLTDNNVVKISDFGMSRVLVDKNQENVTKSDVGPLKWMAPECIVDQKYSPKSDSYAWGITVIEMLTRKEPYPGIDAVNVAIKVTQANMRPDIPKHCPPELGAVLKTCWSKTVEERPDFKTIYNKVYQIVKDNQPSN